MQKCLKGQTIERGYFVTLVGEKVRKAQSEEHYILGVFSSAPSILADAHHLNWHDCYLKDVWRKVLYQVVSPELTDEEGNTTPVTRTEPILNPEWHPSKIYVPRTEREEWISVGLIGKLLV
ncbi:peptidase G2 autoproteolytic cleavage domain-containing protein [Cytobacillus purgationiresistens]|uniref:Peptidase G2 IMC autoproteolytic cleavage domain-containing protein n=1 Tax=Cytobacillus purgationiresistens TaxID=863449 RepID=A0ABU0AG38_9BACI|nr:peptidase G2 autoproteolytic cleavage domain-containing protein [Cytobacillus purgationiresistens]MDQ0269752.1 hypothetical protein [Cytobacillus purgationiresistens]